MSLATSTQIPHGTGRVVRRSRQHPFAMATAPGTAVPQYMADDGNQSHTCLDRCVTWQPLPNAHLHASDGKADTSCEMQHTTGRPAAQRETWCAKILVTGACNQAGVIALVMIAPILYTAGQSKGMTSCSPLKLPCRRCISNRSALQLHASGSCMQVWSHCQRSHYHRLLTFRAVIVTGC